MKKLLIILLLLALAAVTAWQFQEKFRRTGVPLQLYGNVDIRGVDLGFRVAGRLIEVLKDEGDAVQAGELLARLDAQPNGQELARADAQVAAAEADLRLKQAGNRSQDIDQGRAALEESRVVANNAARAYARHAGLVGRGGTSQQDLETAEATRDEAQQRVKVNEAKLRLLEAGFRDEEIAAADAALAQAKAARASAALHVADTELKAPSAGIVLTRALEPGAIVQAGATVLSLSLEQPVWVRAYVHESELGRVPPGTKVLLTTDGQPGRPFHGKVGFVSPRAEFTPKSVETPELRTSLVYRLRVVVEDPDGSLRQGMPVTVLLDPTSP
ncbi:MAG: secretion protein HlyD [Verrucomicrobiota bacterium]